MPERLVVLHLLRYGLLVGVLNVGAQVLLKESVEADLVLVASVAETLRRRRDDTVRDLSVKHAVAVYTILIDKGGAVVLRLTNLYPSYMPPWFVSHFLACLRNYCPLHCIT